MSQIEVVESETQTSEEEERRESRQPARPVLTRRRSSDPSSDRPVMRRQATGRGASMSETDNDDDDDVEDLPDRFDRDGQPLHGQGVNPPRWTSRRGDFRKKPQRPGGWDVSGSWQVAGSDGVAVDRLARSFTEALEGRRGWLGVLGEAFGGSLPPPRDVNSEDNDGEVRRRRRR